MYALYIFRYISGRNDQEMFSVDISGENVSGFLLGMRPKCAPQHSELVFRKKCDTSGSTPRFSDSFPPPAPEK